VQAVLGILVRRSTPVASRHPAWSADAGQLVLEALPARDRSILPALQAVQHAFGYVHEQAIPMVAHALNVSVAETYGVLTFYHELRTSPPASVTVSICTAEACQANGSRALVAQVEQSLAPLGKRTSDGEVEVQEIFCLGNCALGPAALVDGRPIGRVDLARLTAAIDRARSEVDA
jgi:formate dehydrogenase subunit gamma